MLESVELNLTPSCLDCMSWSADGDLAVASGELVHVLIPKPGTRSGGGSSSGGGTVTRGGAGDQWVVSRLQTNRFRHEEWPRLLPQPLEILSLGEEQSESHVIALAWSPPGLGPFARCVLGVLTSNLVLSLWQATGGQSQWTRVAVVNHALQKHFRSSRSGDDQARDGALLQKKQRIRSFSWSPAHRFFKSQESEVTTGGGATWRKHPDEFFIAVANDCDEILCVEVQRPRPARDAGQNKPLPLQMEVVAALQLQPQPSFPGIEPHSLFALSLGASAVTRHVSWGPWIEQTTAAGERSRRHVSSIGLVRGSALQVLRVEASSQRGEEGDGPRLVLQLRENFSSAVEDVLGRLDVKGPLSWVQASDESIVLVAGLLDSCVSLTMRKQDYTDLEVESSRISIQEHQLRSQDTERVGLPPSDWFPVSGVAHMLDKKSGTLNITVASLSSRIARLVLSPADHKLRPDHPTADAGADEADWRAQVDSFRQQYDLGYDLDGHSMAKVWGLASFRGWIAACFTLHPTDIFEHATAARQRTRIVFARPFLAQVHDDADDEAYDCEPWIGPQLNIHTRTDALAEIFAFTLHPDNRQRAAAVDDPSSRKLLYAAVCCVLVSPLLHARLLPAAKSTIQALAAQTRTRIDLTAELSAIQQLEVEGDLASSTPSAEESTPADGPPATITIPAKSREELSAPGARDMFETCEICGAGIEWYAATESQCAEGHVFVRCGISLLSIQDPLYTQQCARCGIEALHPHGDVAETPAGEQAAGATRPTLWQLLFETFDTCVYCGGKFRA